MIVEFYLLTFILGILLGIIYEASTKAMYIFLGGSLIYTLFNLITRPKTLNMNNIEEGMSNWHYVSLSIIMAIGIFIGGEIYKKIRKYKNRNKKEENESEENKKEGF